MVIGTLKDMICASLWLVAVIAMQWNTGKLRGIIIEPIAKECYSALPTLITLICDHPKYMLSFFVKALINTPNFISSPGSYSWEVNGSMLIMNELIKLLVTNRYLLSRSIGASPESISNDTIKLFRVKNGTRNWFT